MVEELYGKTRRDVREEVEETQRGIEEREVRLKKAGVDLRRPGTDEDGWLNSLGLGRRG